MRTQYSYYFKKQMINIIKINKTKYSHLPIWAFQKTYFQFWNHLHLSSQVFLSLTDIFDMEEPICLPRVMMQGKRGIWKFSATLFFIPVLSQDPARGV